MAFCTKCGVQMADDARFCPACGQAVDSPLSPPQPEEQHSDAGGYTPPVYTPPIYNPPEVDSDADIQNNKIWAGLAYLIFFLPLLTCPDSPYGRFHANQGLLVLIVSLVAGIVNIVPIIGWIASWLLGIAVVVLLIIGMINGFTGKTTPLPLVGSIVLLK